MDKEIEMVVEDAASNVACETTELSEKEKEMIAGQLNGLSGKSDDSFIYGLYRSLLKEDDKNGRKR